MPTPRADVRNTLLCVGVSMAALLLAWPFADSPFDDDWTWSFTVLRLWQTGRLLYNGWSSPSVISQAYWGLLWVKAFGFSFNVLRVSTVPFAAGSVALTYALGRRAGLSGGMARFAALTLGLSPVFLPLAATFMTDVPGLCLLLLSLYAVVRGLAAPGRGPAVGWLAAGAVMAVIGGSTRQVVWIVPLVLLPYVAWLRRRDRAVAVGCVVGWAAVLVAIVATQRWFDRQPFSIPDPPLANYVRYTLAHPAGVAAGGLAVGLTVALLTLPAALGAVRRAPVSRHVVAAVLFASLVGLLAVTHLPRAPWMRNILTPSGVLGGIELPGERPMVLAGPVRRGLALTVLVPASLLLASALLRAARPRLAWRAAVAFAFRPDPTQAPVAALLLTLASLVALEMTRCVFGVAFDRHLLPMIPLSTLPLLWHLQRQGRGRMPAFSWISLAVFAAYGIASTQEVASLQRARVAAQARLAAAGVPPTEVGGDFEHQSWTELQVHGHINDVRIRNPPGAYDPTQSPTPGLRLRYVLESAPTAVAVPSRFGTVPYLSFLPPFHRTVYIDRYTDPWWIDPARAATRPVPRSGLPPQLLEQYAPRPH